MKKILLLFIIKNTYFMNNKNSFKNNDNDIIKAQKYDIIKKITSLSLPKNGTPPSQKISYFGEIEKLEAICNEIGNNEHLLTCILQEKQIADISEILKEAFYGGEDLGV